MCRVSEAAYSCKLYFKYYIDKVENSHCTNHGVLVN